MSFFFLQGTDNFKNLNSIFLLIVFSHKKDNILYLRGGIKIKTLRGWGVNNYLKSNCFGSESGLQARYYVLQLILSFFG